MIQNIIIKKVLGLVMGKIETKIDERFEKLETKVRKLEKAFSKGKSKLNKIKERF
jgi:chaperonin cofactor prefoldin